MWMGKHWRPSVRLAPSPSRHGRARAGEKESEAQAGQEVCCPPPRHGERGSPRDTRRLQRGPAAESHSPSVAIWSAKEMTFIEHPVCREPENERERGSGGDSGGDSGADSGGVAGP